VSLTSRPLHAPAILFLVAVGLSEAALKAQPPHVTSLFYSFDTTTTTGAATFEPRDVAQDNLMGSVGRVALGPLPPGVDLKAYQVRPDGTQLFSLDTTAVLPGLAEVRPSDVVGFDGTGYSVVFSGSAHGVPEGASIDALAMAPNGDLLISFDVAVELSGLAAEDRDLLRWNGSTWSIFFDGANEGVPDGLDLDAAHLLSSGHLLLSFDGSGTIGGVAFDDEDVLEYNPVAHSWVLFWDGSSRRPDAVAADLDALYAVEEGPSAIFADGFESGNLSLWSGGHP
jgi:hypothetical protein